MTRTTESWKTKQKSQSHFQDIHSFVTSTTNWTFLVRIGCKSNCKEKKSKSVSTASSIYYMELLLRKEAILPLGEAREAREASLVREAKSQNNMIMRTANLDDQQMPYVKKASVFLPPSGRK